MIVCSCRVLCLKVEHSAPGWKGPVLVAPAFPLHVYASSDWVRDVMISESFPAEHDDLKLCATTDAAPEPGAVLTLMSVVFGHHYSQQLC